MNEDAATSCYIEVHGINKTKFSLIATTKVRKRKTDKNLGHMTK